MLHFKNQILKYLYRFLFFFSIATAVSLGVILVIYLSKIKTVQNQLTSKGIEKRKQDNKLIALEKELTFIKTEDQYVINRDLEKEIDNIQKTYKSVVDSYEKLLSLKEIDKKTESLDEIFTDAIVFLSQRNYASAEASLANLNKQIDDKKAKIASSFTSPANVPTNNTPPASGFRRQQVQSDIGTYLVDIISADLNSTRVIVDTASDSDCSNNCPVLSLGDYVNRNGAFAGVNGSYFCPAEYPSCSGKTNSFDTLLMNKDKKYFNSENNKYSTIPLIYFSNNSAGVRGQTLDWGRDTGVDAVIANQGLLLSGGNVVFGGDGDPKKGSKGSRSFVGNKGNSAYIGVVHNATVAESAHVLKTLGLENALNLDSGGSTALWYSGYKAGPGRNIPNAVLFVRK